LPVSFHEKLHFVEDSFSIKIVTSHVYGKKEFSISVPSAQSRIQRLRPDLSVCAESGESVSVPTAQLQAAPASRLGNWLDVLNRSLILRWNRSGNAIRNSNDIVIQVLHPQITQIY